MARIVLGEPAVMERGMAGRARPSGGEVREINWKVVGALAGVALLALGAFGVMRAVDAQRPRGSDTQQLRTMLAQGEAAAERGDAPAIWRFISDDYSDNLGFSDTSVKYNIRAYLRDHKNMDLTIPSDRVNIHIDPDGRTGAMDFVVIVNSPGASGSGNQIPISLRIRKEPVRYYWLFPGEEWKVLSADGYTGIVD